MGGPGTKTCPEKVGGKLRSFVRRFGVGFGVGLGFFSLFFFSFFFLLFFLLLLTLTAFCPLFLFRPPTSVSPDRARFGFSPSM